MLDQMKICRFNTDLILTLKVPQSGKYTSSVRVVLHSSFARRDRETRNDKSYYYATDYLWLGHFLGWLLGNPVVTIS